MSQTPSEVLSADEAEKLALSMGLLPHEYTAVTDALERTPTRTEIAVFAGMWSEHCSYKSTLHLLKTLPKEGPAVLAGPGSHAGVVDVGDGWAVAFKMESHNHPSAVEPYQGAATGVGGILRDIIAQGARPCAVMDSLCFGMPDAPRTKHLVDGVVAGIAGYGNSFGVPNIGGRTFFHPGYEGNPLVNALAAGMVRPDEMRTANAKGLGNAMIYVGATTGRDGILGAAFASEELGDETHEDRPHVQVGDPFSGKKLMEACLSFTEGQGLIACQDMGAAGITCSAVEMAAAGNVGIDVDLEAIPLREPNMAPQEIMLSESQERFMFIVEKGKEEEALRHFHCYGVHAAVCGRVVEGDRVRVLYKGETVVDVPAELVADGAPPANWPLADALPKTPPYPEFAAPADLGEALLKLLAHPSIASKEELYSHYDQTVGNRSVRGPDYGEAGVLKLPDSKRGFALTLTSRGDLCDADPYLGVKALLGAACRNLACAGAEMLAITDGLNMASPRNPIENLKLKEVIRGLGDGLNELTVPVTGGNVSLYNESPNGPIPPTPMVGAIGVVNDISVTPRGRLQEGDVLFLLGEPAQRPVTSLYGYLSSEGKNGALPAVDLGGDKLLAGFLIEQIRAARLHAAKDGSIGGIAAALAKLCLLSDVGAELHMDGDIARADWWLFGEYPATAWAAVAADDADDFAVAAQSAGVACRRLGTAKGRHLRWQCGDTPWLDAPLSDLAEAFFRTGAKA